jgi:hypothetical protein
MLKASQVAAECFCTAGGPHAALLCCAHYKVICIFCQLCHACLQCALPRSHKHSSSFVDGYFLQEDLSSSGHPLKYVSHKFSGGASCVLTGRPRTAEVSVRCSLMQGDELRTCRSYCHRRATADNSPYMNTTSSSSQSRDKLIYT